MISKIQILVSLLLVATAHATDLGSSEQSAESHNENVRLRAENAALMAKNNALLKEIVGLRAQHGDTDEVLADDQLEEQLQAGARKGFKVKKIKLKKIKVIKKVAAVTSAVRKWAGAQGLAPVKKCSGHCLKDCDIVPDLLDSKCVAPKSRLETVRRSIEFKGNHTWDIHHDKKDTGENKRVIGQVHCPCKDGAKDMSEDEAMRRIFGQVSALPFDQGKVVRLGGGSQRRASQIRLLMKVSFSTKLLLDCWKNTCKKPGNTHGENDLVRLLQDDMHDRATVGWDCG